MEFIFKSKFNLEDVVWFMHDNKPIQGIINGIEYERVESIDTAYEHKNIFQKLKSILNKTKVNIYLRYTLDMIDNNGKYISSPHYCIEDKIFSTKEELLNSL